MDELLINGENAYTTWGVRMGEGFLDVIGASASMKDFIENKSRLEHGKRVIINNPKVDEREISLSRVILSLSIKQRRKLSLMSCIKVWLIFRFLLIVARFTILFILARVSLTHRV